MTKDRKQPPRPTSHELTFVKRTDRRYEKVRSQHYVPDFGTHGQQVHFLISDSKGGSCGVISGASPVYAVAVRDAFFGFTSETKRDWLSAIVNNTVFRLTCGEPNAAVMILAQWRKEVARIWEELYGAKVLGFETFVAEHVDGWTDPNPRRVGTIYRADNWTEVGITAGSTKHHRGTGQGLDKGFERRTTNPKKVFVRWAGRDHGPPDQYVSSWKEGGVKAKSIAIRRAALARGQEPLL